MAKPSEAVRRAVYGRDGFRCAYCGSPEDLSFQHRQAEGMGGSRRIVTVVDGVTACLVHNGDFEHVLQERAFRTGLKVRQWVKDPGTVPVFYAWESTWRVLSAGGGRELITAERAAEMLTEVYGVTHDWATGRAR